MPQLQKTDKTLFSTTVVMVFFGLLMVYSASSVMADQKYGSSTHFVLRQSAWVVLSVAAMMALKRTPYRRLQNPAVAFTAVGVVIVLLAAVYFIDEKNHRWLRIWLLNIQPAEIAKPAIVVFLAYFIAQRARAINDRHTLWPALMAVGAVTFGVVVADLGTAAVIAATSTAVFFVAGLERKYFYVLAAIAFVGGSFAIASRPYRLARLVQFFDPNYELLSRVERLQPLKAYLERSNTSKDTNYQAEQSKIAVGAGGAGGVGLMLGKQKLLYLPEGHTDFIYAVLSEELGMVGSIGVLAAYCVILWRGVRATRRAQDDFGRYLALAVTTMVVVQALMNISVVLAMAPTKGIPLPMISFGGNSLLSTLALMGMLMNVSETAG